MWVTWHNVTGTGTGTMSITKIRVSGKYSRAIKREGGFYIFYLKNTKSIANGSTGTLIRLVLQIYVITDRLYTDKNCGIFLQASTLYFSTVQRLHFIVFLSWKMVKRVRKRWFGVVMPYKEKDNFGEVLPICQDSARLSRPSPCAWPDPAHAWRSARTGDIQRALKKNMILKNLFSSSILIRFRELSRIQSTAVNYITTSKK
jgi:hypothetical protein